jgi:metallo-beta-lactamase family protein
VGEVKKIQHHGAVNGVTGSCHQLHIDNNNSVLIDCGLFQGKKQNTEKDTGGRIQDDLLSINFDIKTVRALIVTHCHIDHVGRIPYLLAAGFRGPIYATIATADLLPLVIEDALKVGVTRNKSIISDCLKLLKNQLIALDYKKWQSLTLNDSALPIHPEREAVEGSVSIHPELVEGAKETSPFTLSLSKGGITPPKVKIKLQLAGHILGSAYVEIDIQNSQNKKEHHRVVFSGDLGAPYAPLLPAPKSPYRTDTLVIESTYGNKNHQSRKDRTKNLQTNYY